MKHPTDPNQELLDAIAHDLASPYLALGYLVSQPGMTPETLDILRRSRDSIDRCLKRIRETKSYAQARIFGTESPQPGSAHTYALTYGNRALAEALSGKWDVWVVVDDDPLIHKRWDEIAKTAAREPVMIHYPSPRPAIRDYSKLLERLPTDCKMHWWIDLNFGVYDSGCRDGIDLIETLGVSQTATLVTSEPLSKEILARSPKAGLAVLQKIHLFPQPAPSANTPAS